MVAAALLQATSLPFIVAATAIGQDLGLIDAATSAGFIAAGLVTVLVFPLTALGLLGKGERGLGRRAIVRAADGYVASRPPTN